MTPHDKIWILTEIQQYYEWEVCNKNTIKTKKKHKTEDIIAQTGGLDA